MAERHVLYRFYSAEGALLYVGISMNPGERFKQHRGDKAWWDEIARIDMEKYESRDAVLAAERNAIVSEKPLHNIMHNSGAAPAKRKKSDTTPSASPYAVGQAVALCMKGGDCHVGVITYSDAENVTLTHKDWVSGYYWGNKRTVLRQDIAEVHHAEWEDPDPWLNDDRGQWRDDHFAGIQSAWIAAHRRAS